MSIPILRYTNVMHLSIRTLIKSFFVQKVLGFNRNVPWPVHWSSTVLSPNRIKPGNRTPGLSKNCHIDGRNGIEFGENVWIGPQVKIISMNHDTSDYTKYIETQPVIIGDNCWIGAGATILPCVNIGQHTVVSAGAVVTKSFPDGDLVLAGVPAEIIKRLGKYCESKVVL